MTKKKWEQGFSTLAWFSLWAEEGPTGGCPMLSATLSSSITSTHSMHHTFSHDNSECLQIVTLQVSWGQIFLRLKTTVLKVGREIICRYKVFVGIKGDLG